MSIKQILIVDDESSLRRALFRTLSKRGYKAITASNFKEAQEFKQLSAPIDLALIDQCLPDGNGLDLIVELKKSFPNIKIMMITGFGTDDMKNKALQEGANHFATKPIDLEKTLHLVDQILQEQPVDPPKEIRESNLHRKYSFDNIIGQSKEIHQVLSLIERVANSNSTVLVTGESGTGKELIAKAIHNNSPRHNRPFVPLNCGAIPGELLESELFGHVKGAFTGSHINRMGRFEVANEGTIFFDEIGEMSPCLQVKLLRVIQERQFEPVGSVKTTNVNVRVIAATNINLTEAVKDGSFRQDLYYRLNVIPIHVPALRERKTDIPLLLQHFLEIYNRGRTQKLSGFTPEALNLLVNYPWPGNVRELENLVERIIIIKGEGLADVTDLPPNFLDSSDQYGGSLPAMDVPETGMDFNSAVDAFENQLIMKALEKTGWNRNQAAILLKLNRTTLVEKIKKKGLRPLEPEGPAHLIRPLI